MRESTDAADQLLLRLVITDCHTDEEVTRTNHLVERQLLVLGAPHESFR